MQGIKKQNYDRAMSTFEDAQRLATANSMDLVQHGSPWHFSLTCLKNGRRIWLYNIYPSKQRIWVNPKFKGPYLNLPRPWTFLDIVNAVIKAKEKI